MMKKSNWQGVRMFSVGALLVSALNLMVVNMNPILWGWLGINAVLFVVSSYKIHTFTSHSFNCYGTWDPMCEGNPCIDKDQCKTSTLRSSSRSAAKT